MTLGERIFFVRKSNNLNQKDFAKMLGISQTHVSKIESGAENPSETLLLFISYQFAVSMEWLKEEKGNYTGNFGSSVKASFDRLSFVRHKIEEKATYMNTDSIWEYVDSISYLEKILDCCSVERLNDREVISYYKSISKLLFHLSQLTVLKKDTQNSLSEIKEHICQDINDYIDAYQNI